MKKSIVFKISLFLFTTFMVSAQGAEEAELLLKKTCEHYNLFEFFERDKIQFTFNVELPGKKLSRDWEWHIQKDKIFMNGEEVGANGAFINDSYWLLFPLRFWYDRSQTQLSVEAVQTPIQKIDALALKIKYVSEAGFTPGDTYILYVTEEGALLELGYYKTSQEAVSREVIFGDPVKVAGITLLTDNKGENFRLFFTDLEIE